MPFSPNEEIDEHSTKLVNSSDSSSSFSYSYQNKPFDSPVKSRPNREFQDIEQNQVIVPSTLNDLENSDEEHSMVNTPSFFIGKYYKNIIRKHL